MAMSARSMPALQLDYAAEAESQGGAAARMFGVGGGGRQRFSSVDDFTPIVITRRMGELPGQVSGSTVIDGLSSLFRFLFAVGHFWYRFLLP